MAATIMGFSITPLIILIVCQYMRFLPNKILSLKTFTSDPKELTDEALWKDSNSFLKLHQKILRHVDASNFIVA